MTTQWGGKLKTQVDGYVGFDSIQEQIRLNSLKRGFEFNVMVVGMYASLRYRKLLLLFFTICFLYFSWEVRTISVVKGGIFSRNKLLWEW